MAAADHTDIVFKNGKWMKKVWHYDENDEYVNDLPFVYGRDGNIHTVNGKYIYDKIEWFRDEYDALYARRGIKQMYGIRNVNFWTVLSRLRWIFRRMERVNYRTEVGVYKDDSVELHIYYDPLKQSYASFYNDGADTYVVLAGYGHWGNVYTHFMSRGYGDEFEEEMVIEAYHWLCDKILEEIVDGICVDWETHDVELERLVEVYGKYDTYLKEY